MWGNPARLDCSAPQTVTLVLGQPFSLHFNGKRLFISSQHKVSCIGQISFRQTFFLLDEPGEDKD